MIQSVAKATRSDVAIVESKVTQEKDINDSRWEFVDVSLWRLDGEGRNSSLMKQMRDGILLECDETKYGDGERRYPYPDPQQHSEAEAC